MRKIITFVLMLFSCFTYVLAQNNISVSGTIIDENNVPMMGVGVMIQGTTNGTITDIDGKYLITVPRNSVLVFSFIGYEDQVVTVDKSTIDVKMVPSAEFLEETVVVGYGVQKRSSVTGAISSVKSEDLMNRSITSIERGLQGKTAGVQLVTTSGAPGSEPSMRIRGYSSNSDSTPLYVVDGLRARSISNLDPNDIESIEILKDAASAAIYGAQAGNGVVLISTKKAESGVTRISYDFQYTINQVARVPEVLDAKEYIQWAVTEGNKVSQEKINQYYDGKTDTDWSKVAFEDGVMKRHNISISGSNRNGSVLASLAFMDDDGPVIGREDYQSRITGTLNAEYRIKPWLKFTTSNNFSRHKGRQVRTGGMYSMMGSVIQMDPLTPVIYSKDNVPAHIQALLNMGNLFLRDENGDIYSMSPYQESNNVNPYIMRDGQQSQNQGFNIRGTTQLDFTPIDHFTFTSRIGYNFRQSASYGLQWPHQDNTDTAYSYVTIDASSSTDTYYQWENFLNYVQSFGKHNVTAMIGTAFDYRETYGVTGRIAGSGSSDIGISKLDRNYAYFSNQSATATKTISGGEERQYANLSYFGRVNYDYDNKYFFQASLRADAADLSVLPLNTRWGYFPAVSAGWTVSKEEFFKKLNLPVSHFKLRASWGQNGSIAGLSNYTYASTITSGIQYPIDATSVSYKVGSYPSSTGNYNLKWETSEQLDLGFDLRLFKDKLTFGFDWFKKETKDLIMRNVTASATVGNTLSPLNAGNVVNSGVELDLSWRDKIGDFTYSVSGNLATLKNEVTYIYETLNRVSGGSGGSGVTTYFEKGYPMWYMRGYRYEGVDPANGHPIFKDINGDNVISDDDKEMIGKGIPDMTYGLTFNFGYKGVDLVVFANGSVGNDICYAVPRSTRNQANTLKYFYDRRWTTPGQKAEYIGAELFDYDKYVSSSALVFDGSYFKIKQIQLGYTFPTKLIQNIALSRARVYVSLDDFFIFTKYPGFDPDVSMSGSSLGIDSGQYPNLKKMVFGLNITF